MRLAGVLASLALGAAACTDLPGADAGVCGNHVVEPSAGEDCDTFAPEGASCGAPGETGACRYLCGPRQGAVTATCPTGMACGMDGVCRFASGTFDAPGTRLEAEHVDLVGGDLDGDGREEVLASAAGVVVSHYFDAAATLAGTLTIRVPARANIAPVVGELSGDGRADVVMPADFGTIVALGSAEREFHPTAHAAVSVGPEVENVIGVYGEVLPGEPGDELIVAGQVNGVSGVALALVELGTTAGITVLPRPSTELAGAPAMAQLDEDPSTSPCEEIVLGHHGDPVVYTLSPCLRLGADLFGLAVGAPLEPVALPDGHGVAGAPTVLDVDRDGHLDLVVRTRDGDAYALVVAYGRGDGRFASQPPAVSATVDDAASVHVTGLPERPLAAAHLDEDDELDYVLTTGVWVSAGGTERRLATPPSRGTPVDAVIGDMNRDGRADVLVATDAASLEFHGAAPGGFFSSIEMSLPGIGHDLVLGDFDGDGILDGAVAARRPGPANETPRDAIGVLWGRPSGPPAPPELYGDLTRVVQLLTTHGREGDFVDATEDLALISIEASGRFSFAGFAGKADRHLRSAYVMVDRDAADRIVQGYFPTRYALGDFTGDGRLDVGASARPGAQLEGDRLWLIPVTGEAVFETDEALPSSILPASADAGRHAVAVDLDGDGIDELVRLSTPPADPSRFVATVGRARRDGTAGWRWGLDAPVEHEGALPAATHADATATTLDLDGDGRRDLLLPLGAAADAGAVDGLVVFWNDGAGIVAAPEPLPTPEGGILAFASLGPDAESTTVLAVLSDGAVWLVRASRKRRFVLEPAPAFEAAGATRLTALDVDGDGVRDLVVGDGTTFRIHRGRPRIP